MLVGQEKLTDIFKKLADTHRLSHAYLFFGEPQVGKFSFAAALANYLETGDFLKPSRILNDTLIVKPDPEGTIGIDAIRGIKRFLLQKPVYAPYRTVVIASGERMTAQAQHALLKVAEEPPETGLIILVVSNPEVLLSTLRSRLQQIYFPRVSAEVIAKMLTKETKITSAKANGIAKISFGRPGRAMELARSKDHGPRIKNKKELIVEMVENPGLLEENMTEMITELAKEPVKNCKVLRSILDRLTKISQFNTNKRLQLETALWNT